MIREQVKIMNNKINGNYTWEKRAVEDVYGNKYRYIQISKTGTRYWAMNTSEDINKTWIIKDGTEFIKRVDGIDNALAELELLQEG